MTSTHATPIELIARARGLEADARWAVGHDRSELLATAEVLKQLAAQAAANDNAPFARGKVA